MLYINEFSQFLMDMSERNLLIRFENISYEQHYVLHTLRHTKLVIGRSPDHFLRCFLYQSVSNKSDEVNGTLVIETMNNIRKQLVCFI